jgi:hypothetical protein
MMLQMLGVFAEFEHATIVDRVTAGLERQPERVPALRARPLPPLRPRLHRHLGPWPQQPLHVLRLLDPLQVRPQQVQRRAAAEGPP